jgi:ribonucleoside-diphosphate reductase alpha chain
MEMSVFAQTIFDNKYAHVKENGEKETWEDVAERLAATVVKPYLPEYYEQVKQLILERKLIPGGRYLYATGKRFHQTQNCLLLDVEDNRESWAFLMERITNGLMTGAGIGVVYSKLRPNGAPVKGMGGKSTGPLALMQMVNEAGRHIMQGGSRRSAIWAGLHWNHGDVEAFIRVKDWSEEVRALKEKDFNFPATLDMTNISVILDDAFFAAYHNETNPEHAKATSIYSAVTRRMCKTGEPGFSIDVGENAGEHLRNACTEVTSRDDNDICNLSSFNFGQFSNLAEFKNALEPAVAFLLCGTLYSLVPYEEVANIREKNRRLGLGIMGMHEWLLKRRKKYGPDKELGEWLQEYAKSTDIAAKLANRLGITAPVKTRAIAPTGTISIIAETTSGIEPIYCVAFKRRYLKGSQWYYQYVIDAAAKRIIDSGVTPESIESSIDLARDVRRRLEFQAFVQRYVDHGISSTINLPAWGSEYNNEERLPEFRATLMEYLPYLRGITCYPDGGRGGQPLTKVDYQEASDFEGYEIEEYGNDNACVGGVCGV